MVCLTRLGSYRTAMCDMEFMLRLTMQIWLLLMIPGIDIHQDPRTLTMGRHQRTLRSTQVLSATRCGDARLIPCTLCMQLWLWHVPATLGSCQRTCISLC